MLHIVEMKFTPGWGFFEIHVPFTLCWKLKIFTHGEMDILTFLHDTLTLYSFSKVNELILLLINCWWNFLQLVLLWLRQPASKKRVIYHMVFQFFKFYLKLSPFFKRKLLKSFLIQTTFSCCYWGMVKH